MGATTSDSKASGREPLDTADSLMQAFVAEYQPQLQPAREGLDSFANGGASDQLAAARRLFHRVAGVSALLGLPELGTMAGMAEDLITLVADGRLQSSPQLVAIIGRAHEQLTRFIKKQSEKPQPKAPEPTPEPAIEPTPTATAVPAEGAAPGNLWTTYEISARRTLRMTIESGDISGSRVLVVDDDPLSARLIELSLKKAGVKVQYCRDPREALAAIDAARPDLILLDLMMPGQDGFETCRQIRAQASVDQVPIVFITRIADVNDKVVALQLGGDDYITKPFEPSELLARVRSHIMKHLQRKEQAFKDALTGAWNHRYYKERIELDLKRAQSSGRTLCLAMMDIDKFKLVNDVHGHAAGDDVLSEFVRRAESTLRKADIVARYGGDEMAIILPDTAIEEALAVMQRVNEAVKAEAFALRSGGSLSVTCSIGVTQALATDTPEMLAERADQALYASKRNGRDRVSTL